MENDIICIYHKDCIDGTTAAAVVLRKFPHARAFPLAHGYTKEDLQDALDVTTRDACVYIVDSVFGLAEFAEQGNQVIVFDHHISVHEETKLLAEKYENVTYHFDNAKSGASLTWHHLFPDEPLPPLVQHVEDNDLWVHASAEDTQSVVSYLSLERNNPERVRELFDINIATIKRDAQKLVEYVKSEIDRAVLAEPVYGIIGTHRVPLFNITNHQSACGNLLATKFDAAVGMYTVLGDEVRISFRSLAHHSPSALTVAQLLGGGGHLSASGARVPLRKFFTMIHGE